LAHPGHGPVEHLGHGVGIGPGPEQVVAAGGEADQIRRHRDRKGHLVVRYLPQQPAADREVGVTQARAAGGQPLGEPVGPAAAAAAVGVRVADAFGEAVAQRDEGAGPRHRVPH
jgi:hypothetical protein